MLKYCAVIGRRLAPAVLCGLLVACGGSAETSGTLRQPSPDPAAPAAGTASVANSFPGARFNTPGGVAFGPSGNLFVADTENHTIRKISADGVTTFAGVAGVMGSADGQGSAARFTYPRGVAVDAAGNVYVTNSHAVRKITPEGVVSTLAGAAGEAGYQDGAGPAARFNTPWGIAIDGGGNLYVGDSQNYVVRRIAPDGAVTTFAGIAGSKRTVDGPRAEAMFQNPTGVALDGAGNVYVADFWGPPSPNLIEGSTYVRKIGVDGQVSTLAGAYNPEQEPRPFDGAYAIAADATGNVFVTNPQSLHQVSPEGAISTIAASSTTFNWLQGFARHPSGDWYLADANAHVVWRLTPDGAITAFAGTPYEVGNADSIR